MKILKLVILIILILVIWNFLDSTVGRVSGLLSLILTLLASLVLIRKFN